MEPLPVNAVGGVEPMVEIDGEIGQPQWVFGQSRYTFLPGGRVAFGCSRNGFDSLMLREADGSLRTLDVPFSTVDSVVARDDTVVFVGASPTTEAAVVAVDPQGGVAVPARRGTSGCRPEAVLRARCRPFAMRRTRP